MRTEPVSGRLVIDLAAIQTNYRFLCSIAAPAPVAAVVKADAYGLGAVAVSKALCAIGCQDFFVAHLNEAVAIVPHLPSAARVYVLNGLMPGEEGQCADLGVIPVLNGVEQVENWARLARSQGGMLPAVLQVDSGMSRLGLSLAEASAIAHNKPLRDMLDLKWLISHLACADERDSEQNLHQLATFRDACALFPETPGCFANSGGIFLGADFRGAMVRSGIALYGGAPTSGGPNPMTPVVSLTVPVVQTRRVSTGAKVGYGGAFQADRPMVLATIAAGYADGLPRSLGDFGAAWLGAIRLPIVGRVSMDTMTIDISHLDPGTVGLGTQVELIGHNSPIDAVAEAAGTISYEILTRLGRRFRRVLIEAVSPPPSANSQSEEELRL
ncbi:alanine racemase [Asticcacaulis benevestitus]|nr:alanine racemase [Asticcacaulis benevestitus]